MPRMPLQPCDHCYSNTSNVTSASENIKLKIMEDKLRNDFAEKGHVHEQYLTEHQSLEGYAKESFVEQKVLELIENNANTKIGFDFQPNITVGYLGPNTPITADMTIGQIIYKMLYCEHDWLPSSCGEPYFCDLCGHNHPTLITDHTPEPYGADIDATCSYPGSTMGVKCGDCGEILVPSETIPQLPHEPSEPYLELEPTCLEAGEEVIRCNSCGEYISSNSVPALGHDYGDWVITKQPEVGVPGEQTKTCKRCGDVIPEEIPALEPEEPTTISYLSGTFGNPDLDQDVQDCPDFLEDFDESEQEAITMHYVNNMTGYSVASEDDLVGRHGFAINTPFVKEPDLIANDYGAVSEDPYLTRPAIILPAGYSVTAWNTDVDNSSLSECTLWSYVLADGRTVYYAADFPQLTGTTTTHYLTISKN